MDLPGLSWPPSAQELISKMLKPPDSVTETLTELLLPTNANRKTLGYKMTRFFELYPGNLVYGVTHRNYLTRRHFLLVTGLHILTGLGTVVDVLNHLGDCIDYDKHAK